MTKFSKTKERRIIDVQILIEGKQIVVDSLTKKKEMTQERLNGLVEASKNKSDKEIKRAQDKLDKLNAELASLLLLREKALTQDSESKQNESVPQESS